MYYKTIHHWNVSPKEAIVIQEKLSRQISLNCATKRINLIAGVDASYNMPNNRAKAGIVVMSYPELHIVERVIAIRKIQFPYVPGLLTFREGPAVLAAIKKLQYKPDVFLFDGQGIAHPRKMGIATHLGIILNKPSIGCAKSRLYGNGIRPDIHKGKYTYLFDKFDTTEIIGAIVRTKTNIRPIYVSQGNKISLQQAIDIVLTCAPKYRIPEPIRQAHILVSG